MDAASLESALNRSEGEFEVLSSHVHSVITTSNDKLSAENDSQLAGLMEQNKKLKYRLDILKKAIEGESTKNGDFIGLQDSLSKVCATALIAAYPGLSEIDSPVQASSKPQFGDYQFNAAMQVAKILRNQGDKCSPLDIAKKIVKNLGESDLIEKVEVAPPGFVNMWLKKPYCQRIISKIIQEGVKPPVVEKMRVVVDFSSPNIAKQMHVGHLRSTIIGDSIAKLLEFLGHDVLRLNHVGDWGTQFGMLIAHLQDEFPDYVNTSPPIHDLQTFYKQSKARFDSDEEFKKRAYSCVVKLQQYEPNYMKAWNLICEASRQEFQQIYDRLEIRLKERGESFYAPHMKKLVSDLELQGLLEKDEGRLILFGSEEGQIPLTIVKSDGGYTYDTSDLAALKHRIEEERGQWIIYVTDAGQATHFKVIFNCAAKCGFWDPKKVRLDHVSFGVVLGEDKKKFKTRSGDTVKLSDLLDEGIKRAEEKLKEKKRDEVLTAEELEAAKKAVAYGCIKYADLSLNRNTDYVFSFDKMLDDKGNTAVYMLYALTRIRSIARNAKISKEQLLEAAKTTEIPVAHEKEWNLVKVILRFYDTVKKITKDLLTHYLCEFLYNVATAFSEFYDACYCIEKDSKTSAITKIHMNRLLLCEATALVMEKCFEILGLNPVSRM